MQITRRTLLAASVASLANEFPVRESEVCLNNARWHPLSAGARKAIEEYLTYKASGGGRNPQYSAEQQRRVKELFATLIGARPTEISFVPSTMAGENMIVTALGLPEVGGNVVTDGLHFEGSLYLYGELQRQGLDVRMARPRDGRIEIGDLEKLIDKKTKLVALSLVSMINGFQHDLKAVCDLAHARGAYVFADIVQAAGAVPVDVRASGVDFCACASYKWLMGDMGLGFLYVREELVEKLRRPQYGYRQLSVMQYHAFPFDPPGEQLFEWKQTSDAAGHFEVGTVSNTTVAALSHSLDVLNRVGVEKIQQHRQPFLRTLQAELPRFGLQAMTPADSTSPIVAFSAADTSRLAAKLARANVDVAVYPNRLRISPSIYNNENDINRLLNALE